MSEKDWRARIEQRARRRDCPPGMAELSGDVSIVDLGRQPHPPAAVHVGVQATLLKAVLIALPDSSTASAASAYARACRAAAYNNSASFQEVSRIGRRPDSAPDEVGRRGRFHRSKIHNFSVSHWPAGTPPRRSCAADQAFLRSGSGGYVALRIRRSCAVAAGHMLWMIRAWEHLRTAAPR